jgi:hypothetical protein
LAVFGPVWRVLDSNRTQVSLARSIPAEEGSEYRFLHC